MIFLNSKQFDDMDLGQGEWNKNKFIQKKNLKKS